MRRLRASLPVLIGLILGCDFGPPRSAMLWPEPGLPRYQRFGAIPVPGGIVNAAGGNFIAQRVDLSIDTRLGTREVGAVWNSSRRRWRWSFEIHFRGRDLVDPTGAEFDVPDVTDGRPIPGSHWAKLDDRSLRSLGGLVHEFDADGRLVALHWSSGEHPRLEYGYAEIAGAPRLESVVQCSAPGACHPVYSVSYDAAGRVVALVDRAGRMAEFEYAADGHLVTARDALDTERGLPGTRYEYVGDGVLRAITSSEGERIELDIGWNVPRILEVRRMGAEPSVHRFGYGSDSPADFGPTHGGYVTRYDGPDGRRSLFRIDRERRLRRIELPGGEVVERDWVARDVSRLTLPDGATTSWEHVDFDEVIRTDPSGNRVRIDFRMNGGENRAAPWQRPVESVEDDLGTVQRRGFEGGRLVWSENGAGERSEFSYDSENMPARVTLPDGVAASFSEYGEHGHPGRIGLGAEVETRSYDAVGNLLSRSGFERHDQRPGGEVSRAYDGDRNVREIVSEDAPLVSPPLRRSISLEWRSDGRPLRILRPGGGDHEWIYDAAGRLVERRERVDGAWRSTTFEVDVWGRTVSETLPNGMRREMEVDASGFVTRLAALRDGILESEVHLVWSDGRLRALDDSAAPGPEFLSWDAAGRVAAIDFPHGERLEIDRDARGRVTREAYLDAASGELATLDREYDLADRPTRLLESGLPIVTHGWVDGRLDHVTTGNGLVRHHAYEAASGLPAGTATLHPTLGCIEATALEVVADASGVRWHEDSVIEGPAESSRHAEALLGPPGAGGKRLLGFDTGGGAGAYAYAALGALTSSPGRTHVHNAEGNRLLETRDAATGQTLVDYERDAAGFVTSRAGLSITWSAWGRVTSVGASTFQWDALGRPVGRADPEPVRHRFGGRVEADVAGNPLRLDLGEVVLSFDGGGTRYRHADFRGNTRTLSDASGRIVGAVEYGPYGVEAHVGEWHPDSTFAGGRSVQGLVLIGHRLLDPESASWLAPDPVLQVGSQFAYAMGEPVRFWDATGRQPEASPAAALPEALEAAIAEVVLGMALTSVGVFVVTQGAFNPVLAPLAPAILVVGGSILGAGISMSAVGALNLAFEIRRARSEGAGPGAPGVPGVPGASLPAANRPGPGLRLSLPPNPGCPCGDGLPDGGHVGGDGPTGAVGSGFGWGGFGFAGF